MIYRPQFWYWEVVNMIRRLLLTCVVVLCETLAITTVYVVFVSIITLVVEREAKPYCNLFLSSFTYCGSWLIVMFVLYLLLLVSQGGNIHTSHRVTPRPPLFVAIARPPPLRNRHHHHPATLSLSLSFPPPCHHLHQPPSHLTCLFCRMRI